MTAPATILAAAASLACALACAPRTSPSAEPAGAGAPATPTAPGAARVAPAPPPTATEPGTAASRARPAASPAAGAPLTVKWVPRREGSTELELVARVEFRMRFDQPVAITVRTPPGVRLLSGPERWDARAPEDFAPVEAAYTFAIDGSPTGDIVLAADLSGPGFGVHGKDAFAVGVPRGKRSEAKAPAPEGPSIRVNGQDLGPTHEMKPAK